MKKPQNFISLFSLAAFSLGTTEGAIWYSITNNRAIDDPGQWDDTFGAGGTNPSSAMNVDNDDTWIIGSAHRMNRGGSNNFFGTLQVDNNTGANDGEYLNRGGSNFENIVLNGGALNSFRSNGAGISANTISVTATGGILGGEDDPSRYTFGAVIGSSEILIQKRGNGSPTPTTVNDGRVIMEAGTDYSGFTGIFRVQSDTSTNGRGFFEFAENISTATFGLQLDAEGSFTLQNAISVTSLQIGADSIAPGGGSGPGGAYLFSDFTPAQQAFFADQGGSINVVPIPEPSMILLLGTIPFVFLRRGRPNVAK